MLRVGLADIESLVIDYLIDMIFGRLALKHRIEDIIYDLLSLQLSF